MQFIHRGSCQVKDVEHETKVSRRDPKTRLQTYFNHVVIFVIYFTIEISYCELPYGNANNRDIDPIHRNNLTPFWLANNT